MSESGEIDSERLAEQIGWVRRLAHGLVSDPHLAEDLVQETWLAFLRRRPDTSRPLEPWFARVLTNFARRARRSSARRAAREEDAALPESLEASSDVYARAALHRELVAAVLALEEPYRGALLLRYLDEVPPREIARRQGIPVRTVNTRLRRGLGQLRARLDREHTQDRDAWLPCLVAFAVGDEARRSTPWPWFAGTVLVSIGALVVAFAASRGAFDDAASSSAFPEPAAARTEIAVPAAANARDDAESDAEHTVAAERVWTGRVIDELDRPVAGASVTLRAEPRARLGRFDPPLSIPATLLAETRTSTDGRFRLAVRFAGSNTLVVSARGCGPTRLVLEAPPEDELVVRVPRAAELAGRTLGSDGLAVDGARVFVRALTGAAASSEPLATVSRDDGAWRFEDLAPGPYRLEAFDARGGAHAALELELVESRTLDVRLVPTARIAGRVVDARSRRPLAGATLALAPHGPTLAVTDEHGAFTLAAPAALRRLQLRLDAAQHASERVVLDPVPPEGFENVEFVLEPGRRAQGCVVDVDGAPLANAWVAAVSDLWRAGRHEFDRVEGRTGADGCFELTGLRRELAHTLLVACAGRAPRALDFPRSEAELELVDLGRVQLERGGTAHGRVRDEFGAPRAAVELVLLDLGPRGTASASIDPSRWASGRAFARVESDAEGRFRFEDLPAGAWWLGTETDVSRERVEHEFDVAAGELVELELVAARHATLRGVVRSGAGTPIAAAELVATRGGVAASARGARTRSDGSFELTGLAPGAWDVRVTPPPGLGLAPLVTASSAPADGLMLAVPATELVRGRVLDFDGAPVPYARVSGTDALGCALESTWCDAAGRFVLPVPARRAAELVATRTRLVGPWERGTEPGESARLRLESERDATAELELRFAR